MPKAGNAGQLEAVLRQGVALQRNGRLREAETIYRQILRSHPAQPQALHFLGLVAKAAGLFGEAEKLIRRALEVSPGYAEAWFNLGTTLRQVGRLDEAVQAFETALALKPESLANRLGLGETLLRSGRNEAGLACQREVVARHPDDAAAHFALANALQETGDWKAAVASYGAAARLDPKIAGLNNNLAAALIKLGDLRAALAAAEAELRQDPQNPPAIAYKAQALWELGREAEAEALVDYDRFIFQDRLTAPEGFASLAEFNTALVHDLGEHPTLSQAVDPKQRAIRGGAVALAVNSAPTPAIAALERAFQERIQGWAASLPDDPAHPFLCRKPNSYGLNMWGNLLTSQGYQAAHIHNAGWVSGVYYAAVPRSVSAKSDSQEGWIEFGRPGYGLPSRVAPRLHALAPEAGMMLLFPSYFWHRTLPFEGESLRVSVAFDLQATG